jgi:hypothetical protein
LELNEIEELKIKTKKRKLAKQILIEICYNLIFLQVLFAVSYTNKDGNSYNYQKQVKSFFDSSLQINNISELWSWLKSDFINNFQTEKYYNGQKLDDLNLYLSDYNSVLIGYPTIRQIRVKKSNYNAFLCF